MGNIADFQDGVEDDVFDNGDRDNGINKDKMSTLELKLIGQIESAGLPIPVNEHRFHETRKWRFDFAYPDLKVAIEVEGGTFSIPVKCNVCGALVKERGRNGRLFPVMSGGRHSRGLGMTKDAEKYNEAAILGWKVIRVTKQMMSVEKVVQKYSMAIRHIALALGIQLNE